MYFRYFVNLIFKVATIWNLTHSPTNKVEEVRRGFNKDKNSGPIKKETHLLILQSTTLSNEQKKADWDVRIKPPVKIK